jgi:hypothetical protein
MSADMIGVPDTEIVGSEIAGSEAPEESDASDDSTEIANANEEQPNLQR